MFKGKWFTDHIVEEAPRGGKWVRRWDLAASIEADSAFTAGALVGLVDGKLFVADMRRGQWNAYERDREILAAAKLDGRSVEVWLPQDPGQAGKSQKPHFGSLLHGYDVRFERETQKKDIRAEPYASQAQAGNVHLVRGHWNRAFIEEHESFPAGKLKDQVDAMSGAYSALIGFVEDPPVGGYLFGVDRDEDHTRSVAAGDESGGDGNPDAPTGGFVFRR